MGRPEIVVNGVAVAPSRAFFIARSEGAILAQRADEAASRWRTTRAGTPTATLPSGRSRSRPRSRRPRRRSPRRDAVEHLRPRPEPHVRRRGRSPRDVRGCSMTGTSGLFELMAAADEVGVGREETVAADRDRRAGEDLRVEADVRRGLRGRCRRPCTRGSCRGRGRRRPRCGSRGWSRPWRRAPRGRRPRRRPRGGSCGDGAARRLGRTSTFRPTAPRSQRIGDPAQQEAEGAGHPGGEGHDNLVEEQPAEARLPTTRSWYFDRGDPDRAAMASWMAMGCRSGMSVSVEAGGTFVDRSVEPTVAWEVRWTIPL